MIIRPFDGSESDIQAITDIDNAVWPDYPTTVEEFKHNESTRDPKYMHQRPLVEIDGQVVAHCVVCEPWWSMKPGKYYIDISVHPEYRRQGIGSACYEHLMGTLAEYGPTLIEATTRENQAGALRFLTKRGFKQTMREPVSYLYVDQFDPAPFSELSAKVVRLGIRMRSLSHIAESDPDCKRKLWDLYWELEQDVPCTDPPTRPSFENFQERTLGSPQFSADGHMIALDGDRWVGMSVLWLSQAENDKLYTGLTGVSREYRRKGIATAMKVRAIAFAKDYGAKIIETSNEEGNPMYDLNLKLGFEPQSAWLEFRLDLNEPTSED
jgi:GNAT superfamily N-acetyltransferase